MDGIDDTISRLEEALERQRNTDGFTPIVEYCFDCDDISVGGRHPDECLDHNTVSSDGHEHDGVGAAITALRSVGTETDGGDC